MKRVLVDIDVLVEYLRGHPRAVDFVETFSERIILSSLVVAELGAAALDDADQEALHQVLSLFPVVPVNWEVAVDAAKIRRGYTGNGGVTLADAILAATARAENAELKTLSPAHYPMIEDLKPAWTE